MSGKDIQTQSRTVGWTALVTGIASIALLLGHPTEHATDFGDLLKEEAANQILDAIVHGGFLFVLAVQLVCYSVFSGRIGWNRSLAVTGITFFAVGAALQMASLVVDGLMIPAIAQRYLAAPPDRLPYARSLFAFCGIAVQFLMPMGLGFQAAGIASWGAALFGRARAGSGIALLLGLAIIAALVGALMTGAQHLLMIAIAGLPLWAFTAGTLMIRRAV